MSPINANCPNCGRTVKAPTASAGKLVRCPVCGGRLRVPEGTTAEEKETLERVELTCKDCGRAFSVPRSRSGAVVSCPSCGSWVKAGEGRRSILYQDLPMPFRFSSSIVRWLRFFAGFNLICGLAAAVWLGIYHTTEPMVETAEGAEEIVEEIVMVINPWGVLATFAAATAAVVGTVILMALYWILRNVDAIQYRMSQTPEEQRE